MLNVVDLHSLISVQVQEFRIAGKRLGYVRTDFLSGLPEVIQVPPILDKPLQIRDAASTCTQITLVMEWEWKTVLNIINLQAWLVFTSNGSYTAKHTNHCTFTMKDHLVYSFLSTVYTEYNYTANYTDTATFSNTKRGYNLINKLV